MAAGAVEAEAAAGVLGAAGGLLGALAVVAVAAVAAVAAAHPQRMDRDTWGLHPGPPPQSHGSAQKCPSWGQAGFPAAQSPTPKPPSLQRCPQRKPGIRAPPAVSWLQSSPSGWLRLSGVVRSPDAATQECIVVGRGGGQEGSLRKERGRNCPRRGLPGA